MHHALLIMIYCPKLWHLSAETFATAFNINKAINSIY